MNFIFDVILASLVGGMLAFQLLFAPLLFTKLEMPIARKFIRAFFPFYYIYFGGVSLLGAIVASTLNLWNSFSIFALCFVGFLLSRQKLMPGANDATDSGNQRRFNLYHRTTVLINTLQLAGLLWLICING